MKRAKAFTLVELLVVVSIIVVLLALLMPALSKATYQATLLKCAANYKMLANSSTLYAFDFKKFYPHRDLPAESTGGIQGAQPHKLLHVGTTRSGAPGFDLRPMLRDYVPIQKVFNDPFCEPLDYDRRETTQTTTAIYTSVFYWAGWYYKGRPGMSKVGDAFEAVAADAIRPGQPIPVFRSRVIAGDIDCGNGGTGWASHPDFRFLRNRVSDTAAWIESNWTGWAYRAPLDLNYAYDDGSVIRKTQVDYFEDDMARIYNFNIEPTDQLNHVPIGR